ncbi:hypothetical protein HanIR_Chr14g0686601 [Helianthus annuus]|nr:hypothetical protein HanIR_Chr14g0686601 [Helianthus annuus]
MGQFEIHRLNLIQLQIWKSVRINQPLYFYEQTHYKLLFFIFINQLVIIFVFFFLLLKIYVCFCLVYICMHIYNLFFIYRCSFIYPLLIINFSSSSRNSIQFLFVFVSIYILRVNMS